MASEGALWASLTRAAAEAGRLIRGTAEDAAASLSGALGRDERRLKLPSAVDLAAGPITAPYKLEGKGISWQSGYLASCAVSVVRAVQHNRVQPVVAALVGGQALLHARPGGYRLAQVGLNARRVLHYGEWRRLATALALHADLPHLASNCTSLVLEGLPLERRLGSARFLALVASGAALSQALYLLATHAAARWVPSSALASDYFLAYSVGSSGVALALKVVAGYAREADLAAAKVEASEEFVLTAGRLSVWPSLLVSHLLVPSASVPGHLCGVAAGLLHVYGARALGWLWRRLAPGQRRVMAGGRLRARSGATPALLRLVGAAGHPRLGWSDLGSQVLLGAGTCAVMYAARKRR